MHNGLRAETNVLGLNIHAAEGREAGGAVESRCYRAKNKIARFAF